MITVFSATNRLDSESIHFARKFTELFRRQTETQLLDLAAVSWDFIHKGMYETDFQSNTARELQDQYLLPVDKFFFVLPEYNGSFPGVLKLLIDACSVREYQKTFHRKKAALCGVATGRAGNLRGIEHLTGILHHVGTLVMPRTLPISSIGKLLDDSGRILDRPTLEVMESMVNDFVQF